MSVRRRPVQLLYALLGALLMTPSQALELIAHRGYACRAPENSVQAVADAWLVHADGVEVDVRVTRDRVVILYHDAKLDGQPITSLTYGQVQRAADLPVATLRDVLALDERYGFYVLDLKEPSLGSDSVLTDLIIEGGIDPKRLVFQSESAEQLAEIQKIIPNASYHFLSRLKRRLGLLARPSAQQIVAELDGFEFDGVSLKGRQAIDESYVKRLRAAGLRVFVWTINDLDRARHYESLGVDGLITDEPDLLRNDSKNNIRCPDHGTD